MTKVGDWEMFELKYHRFFLILFMILASLVSSFSALTSQAHASPSTVDLQVPWWNESWAYRWPVNITSHSTDEVYNHQVCVVFNSSNFNFSKAKDDGSDLRFIYYDAAEGTQRELNYWIESWNLLKCRASIWVKIPSISAGKTTTIYAYYGNSDVTTESNFDSAMQKLEVDEWTLGLWHFDEGMGTKVDDESVNGNDGTLHGASWTDLDGGQWDGRNDVIFSRGSALEMDGIDDYIRLPNSPSLNPNYVSCETWVKLYGYQEWQRIVIKWANPGNRAYILTMDGEGDNAFFAIEVDTTMYDVRDPDVLSLNEWHHVVGTFDGSELRLYIDGELKAFQNVTGVLGTSTSDIGIGAEADGSANWFKGIIDEVRILRKALSIEEIKASYERRKYTFPEPTIIISPLPIRLEVLQPIQGAMLGGTTEVRINVTSQAHQVVSVNLKICNSSGVIYKIELINRSIAEWGSSWDTTDVSNGLYNLKAEITTFSGEVKVFDLVDIEVKNIRLEVLKPKQGVKLSEVVEFLINVTSGFDSVTTITLKVCNNSKILYSLEMVKVSSREWNVIWNTTKVPYGSYSIKAGVNTTLGDIQTFSLIQVVKPIPPIILELVKPKKASLSDTVEFIVNVTSGVDRVTGLSLNVCKNSTVVYSIPPVRASATEWHATWDTTMLSDGSYTIKAELTTLTGDVQTFNLTQVQVKQTLWSKITTLILQESTVLTFMAVMVVFALWTLTLKERR